MAFNTLYKNVFHRDLEEPGTTAALVQVTKEHPYFSLAHFFLLKNTDPKSKEYGAIAATTALHINNPFLLNAQLYKTAADETVILLQMKEKMEEPIIDEEVPITEASNETVEVTLSDLSNLQLAENYAAQQTNIEEKKELTEADEKMDEVISAVYNNELRDDELSPAVAEQTVVDAIPAMHIPKPTEETADSLTFEPLHTTDYFASQGIKLSQEVLPTDKLGKQLKSFTEWLKTMKKVHDATPLVNDQLDSSVQHLAEISNKDAEVITETMADVFLQQRKINKAKEIYVKLSLLNPDKSAYFTAKLENLK